MTRPFALALAAIFSIPLTAHAQVSFDSDICYVQYTVTMKTDFTPPQGGRRGGSTAVYKYDAGFDTLVKLNMRNMGQVLSMNMAQFDQKKMQNMSPAEQMQLSQHMLDAMQYTANWMAGAPENVDDGDAMQRHMIDVSVPVHINYEYTESGNDLVSEMGSHFDYFARTTLTYSGGTGYTSPDQAKFEMNKTTKKYWLSLPFNFKDMTGEAKVQFVTVSKSRAHGATAWDPEERKSDETLRDTLGEGFRYDAPPGSDLLIPLIEGTADASGKIAGEESFTGHIDRLGPDVPVTLTYRYVVTSTPPGNPSAKK